MDIPVLDLGEACDALARGDVVLFPTETYYGLAADACNPDALGKVYAAKGRPYRLPLPVIIGEREQLGTVCRTVPPEAERLMDLFWPGSLTIVLPVAPTVPDLLTAGTGKVAVRLCPHPAAAALCRSTGLVLSSSSANISGKPPVWDPTQLDLSFAESTAGLYEATPRPAGGPPSTIVDIAGPEGCVRILRDGAVCVDALRAAGFRVGRVHPA